MSGEKNLAHLLASMSPVLKANRYVFCTFKQGLYEDFSELGPMAFFQEKEGVTLVLEQSIADDYQLPYDGAYKCITLDAHSSLSAIGLTAAVSGVLAENDVSANVMAAYYHDHIFVPADQAEKAYNLLKKTE